MPSVSSDRYQGGVTKHHTAQTARTALPVDHMAQVTNLKIAQSCKKLIYLQKLHYVQAVKDTGS